MGLMLGNRQLAMLREMGVRVWQPVPKSKASGELVAEAPASVAPPEIAMNTGAARAHIYLDSGTLDVKKQPSGTHFTLPAVGVSAAVPGTASADASWQIGALQVLFGELAVTPNAPRWLVLLEAPASALQSPFNALDGDAGKLLDNMLRATGMHALGTVLLAPLVRGSGASQALPPEWPTLLASAQADVVLVMGRLAAQAVLGSSEPLARLRGQVHSLSAEHTATKTIVTLDPTYLLRNPLDKAKAWDDLCLALSLRAP